MSEVWWAIASHSPFAHESKLQLKDIILPAFQEHVLADTKTIMLCLNSSYISAYTFKTVSSLWMSNCYIVELISFTELVDADVANLNIRFKSHIPIASVYHPFRHVLGRSFSRLSLFSHLIMGDSEGSFLPTTNGKLLCLILDGTLSLIILLLQLT